MSLLVSLRSLVEQRKKAASGVVPGGTTPIILARCVAKVASNPKFSPREGSKVSAAFAICTRSLQKAGIFDPGSRTLTAKGKKRNAEKAKEKDTGQRIKTFETLLKKHRKKK